MIGPLELVQNYERAAKELIKDGKNEQAKKELKKAISAILDQQENFDPDEIPGLIKTIENIFMDFLEINDHQDAYDSIILMNAFSTDKKYVSGRFKHWLQNSPKESVEQLKPRILKFIDKSSLYKEVWNGFTGAQAPTSGLASQSGVNQKSITEIAEQSKDNVKVSERAQPTSPNTASPEAATKASIPMDNVTRLKITLASTEIARGNLDNAYTILNDILKVDPNNSEARDLILQVEDQRKKIEQQKMIDTLVKSVEPVNAEEEEILKKFFSKQWKESNDMVTRAIARDRNNSRLWIIKSQILKKMGDEKMARNFEEYARKIDPDILRTKLYSVMESFR